MRYFSSCTMEIECALALDETDDGDETAVAFFFTAAGSSNTAPGEESSRDEGSVGE